MAATWVRCTDVWPRWLGTGCMRRRWAQPDRPRASASSYRVKKVWGDGMRRVREIVIRRSRTALATVLLNIGKCLTFRFLLHRGRFRGSPGTDVSAILSTGCHRGTRGEMHQVDCRVAIPIVDDAAFNA